MKLMRFATPLLVLLSACAVQAAPLVSIGDYSVPTGQSLQVSIQVSDDGSASAEDIEGMNFAFQIASGTGKMPAVTNVNLLSGTIWSAHVSSSNVSVPDGGTQPQFQARSLITDDAGDFVSANGIVAVLTIDTTGAALGDYALLMTATIDPGSDSSFLNGNGDAVTATFTPGNLRVTGVPEPAMPGIASLVPFLTLGRRRR